MKNQSKMFWFGAFFGIGLCIHGIQTLLSLWKTATAVRTTEEGELQFELAELVSVPARMPDDIDGIADSGDRLSPPRVVTEGSITYGSACAISGAAVVWVWWLVAQHVF